MRENKRRRSPWPFWLKPASVFPDFTGYGTVTMGRTRALVTIRTVGGSLASESLQLLSGDGQTIDTDIQRRADTVTTSMQIQKSIDHFTRWEQHCWQPDTYSEGKQLGQARVDGQYC